MIKNRQKMRSTDRILVLEKVNTEDKSSTGLVDVRLFKGENILHAVQHPEYSTWTLKYEHGILPKPLKQTFTSFQALYTYTENYFKRRNARIAKVID